jgi:hypothetical protein
VQQELKLVCREEFMRNARRRVESAERGRRGSEARTAGGGAAGPAGQSGATYRSVPARPRGRGGGGGGAGAAAVTPGGRWSPRKTGVYTGVLTLYASV